MLLIKVLSPTEVSVLWQEQLASRMAILDESRKETHMETLTQDHKRTLTTKAVDDAGQERLTDASPYTWEATPSDVVTLTPTADGRACDVLGVKAGTAIVKVTADADPEAPVVPIFGSVDIQVMAVLATKIEITVGPEGPA